MNNPFRQIYLETLKGNQHKLDVDKDGKVEGEDLAKLRAKKMANEEEELEEATPTKQQVKQGIGIARDKRYAGGNVTGAVNAMDKLNKGIAQHPVVKKELQKQNETMSAYDKIIKRFKNLSGSSLEKTAADHGKDVKDLQQKIDAQKVENERRKAAMKTEEVEEIDEVMGMYTHYVVKHPKTDKIVHHEVESNTSGNSEMENRSILRKKYPGHKVISMDHKNKKLDPNMVKEEVEELEELSKGTLASYAKKAVSDARFKQGIGKDYEALGKRKRDADTKAMFARMGRKVRMKSQSREAGVGKAIDRLAKEEVELDEISKKTLGSYVNKASVDMANRTADAAEIKTRAGGDYAHNISRGMSAKTADAEMKKDYAAAKPDIKKAVKRMYGISKAVGRLAKEEVELDEGMKPYVSSTPPKMGDKGSHDVIDKNGKVVMSHPHTPEGMKAAKDHLKKMQEEVELDERNKQNALMRKTMDASRGARFKLNNPVPDADPKHKTAQAQNKAIGRALRNEDAEQVEEGIFKGSVEVVKQAVKVPYRAAKRVAGAALDTVKDIGDAAANVKQKFKENTDMTFTQEELQLIEQFIEIAEKMHMTKASMGDVIKDFKKSDAPQFKGKSEEKRREMGIAAKLSADRETKKEEMEIISFKGFTLDEIKMSDLPSRKITGRGYGTEYYKSEKEKDKKGYDADDEKDSSEKRGRGRPKGSASGARQKGSTPKKKGSGVEMTGYPLHLPNR